VVFALESELNMFKFSEDSDSTGVNKWTFD
jgi:hypothetical protein